MLSLAVTARPTGRPMNGDTMCLWACSVCLCVCFCVCVCVCVCGGCWHDRVFVCCMHVQLEFSTCEVGRQSADHRERRQQKSAVLSDEAVSSERDPVPLV